MNKANAFKFVTLPVSVACAGAAIAGAELVSVPLMATAAVLGGVGVLSLVAARSLNYNNSTHHGGHTDSTTAYRKTAHHVATHNR